MKNDDTFKMRLRADERAMLGELAERLRTPASHLIREYIRREHRRVFGATTKERAR